MSAVALGALLLAWGIERASIPPEEEQEADADAVEDVEASSASSGPPLVEEGEDYEEQAVDGDMVDTDGDVAVKDGEKRGLLRERIQKVPICRWLGLHHLAGLPIEFWLVAAAIASYSSAFYTFLAFGADFFVSAHGMTVPEAGRVVGIVSIASAVISPLSGLAMDKLGGRAPTAAIALGVAAVSFAGIGIARWPTLPCVVAAAVAYSLCPAALYPLIADYVPEEAFTQVTTRAPPLLLLRASSRVLVDVAVTFAPA